MAFKYIILSIFSLLQPVEITGQEIYSSNSVKIEFFSSAPVENIQAVTNNGISVWNLTSLEITFLVQIQTFQFRKAKMQTHFNENFMESREFPYATFKGIGKNLPSGLPDGIYPIELTGELEIKGIKKYREIPAKLKIENAVLSLESNFKVACKDHNIEIPRIFWKNIAEVIDVKVEATYLKKKK